MTTTWTWAALLVTMVGPTLVCAGETGKTGWSARGAEAYLDGRAEWWMGWPPAQRDKGTFCISCHTTMPYALARPALRGETARGATEARLVENVAKRVRMWKEIAPVYNDEKDGAGKTAQAWGTESVLNAVILASEDAHAGKLSADTRLALLNMWERQLTAGDAKGSWAWLNFHNEPWEADDSEYWGAAVAAVAVGTAPEGYAALPENQARVKMLVEYLRQGGPKESLLNRVWLLWAQAKLPGLMTRGERAALVEEIFAKQQADGGWSASSLVVSGWKRRDGTPMDTVSDGYATGLAAYALEQAGVGRTDEKMGRAIAWLIRNQDPDGGGWPSMSLNKQRDPKSYVGRFMRDAATAYSSLALTAAE